MKEDTKAMILSEARRMFRQNGFSKMRMVDLAKNLNISRGNLSYYFLNKDSLVRAIWVSYADAIYRWIDDSSLPFFNDMTRRLYMTMIFDINIFTDPQICQFYYEQMDSEGFKSFFRRISSDFILPLISNDSVRFNSDEVDYLLDSLMGSYRAMDMKYMKDEKRDLDQYIYIKQKIRINMFSAIKPNTFPDLEAAIQVLKEQDFSGIRCI